MTYNEALKALNNAAYDAAKAARKAGVAGEEMSALTWIATATDKLVDGAASEVKQ